MEKSIEKFLEFNGKVIYFLAKDGTYWIAIKPICEALDVNFNAQYQNIKSDQILKAAYAVQHMQVDQVQVRKYVCLPEFYVYGWLFKIKSNSQTFLEYQWKCYEILYKYFHGTITSRETIIGQKTKAHIEHDKLIAAIRATPEGQRLYEVEKLIRVCNTTLRDLDKEIIQNQLPLFS
jgi:hypothetical protein